MKTSIAKLFFTKQNYFYINILATVSYFSFVALQNFPVIAVANLI